MNIKIPLKRSVALLALTMTCITAFAQKTVTGTVVNESGEAMIGVSVRIKGSTAGTITDANGKFSIPNVKDDAVIITTYVGFAGQELPVGTKSVFYITMKEDTRALDEVVVVGYGTQKKRDLTGSIGSVTPKAITMKGSSTMLESLQGQVPGVSITQNNSRAGGGFDIQVRGIQTISSKKEPLYVVDGIVVSDIQFLNPADIERVDVLKDASSSAIYGSRASGGVVIVTTKSAKTQGAMFAKPTISYDAYVGSRQIAHMPDFMDGMDFMQYRFARYTTRKGRVSKDGSVIYEITPANLRTSLLLNYTPVADANGILKVGSKYWNEYYPDGTGMSNIEKLMANGDGYNWRDLVTQDATQQNHFLSVSGAAGGTSYHFGMGYQQDEGVFLKDNEERYNLKAAIESKISNRWTAGISLNLARTIDEWGSDDAVKNAFLMNPYCVPYDADGKYYLQSGIASVLGTTNSDQFTSTINPLIDMDNTVKGAKKLHVLGNVYLQFSPFKNLYLKSTLSPNIYQGRTHYYATVNTAARNTLKSDRAEVEFTNMFDYTWDNQMNYSVDFGEHSISLMGLFSMNKYSKEDFNQYAEKFPFNTTYYNMKNAATVIASESGYTENSLISYAARVNYSYKDKYMITGTIRADGSSRFAKTNRWGSFPSAAVAWRASEEEFLKRDWLDNLKFRFSYGVTGNNEVGSDYATVTSPSATAYYAFGTSMAYGFGPNGIVNKNLRWEKTSEIDLGVDMSVLKNRVNLTADIYDKTSKDLLLKRKLAIEAGGGATVYDNIGSVGNKGLEISLNTVNVKTKYLRWETTFSFAANKNEIKELYGGTVKEDVENAWFVGEPVNVFYNYTLDGIVNDKPLNITLPKDVSGFLSNGNTIDGKKGDKVLFDHAYEYYCKVYGLYEGMPIIKDLDHNGVIDDNDKSIIGEALPDWTGSFSTTLTYKNWDLSATVYTKQGYMVSSPFLRQYQSYKDRGMIHINMDYYIPAGTPVLLADGTMGIQEKTHYGSYPYPNNTQLNSGIGAYYGNSSTAGVNYLVDASYVKVKNIVLGYTLPRTTSRKIGINDLRIYANILNPFVFTKYKGFDPEWASASLSEGGPSTITYQVGVNLKF